MKVVIIGGVAGGATAAARLRRLDEKAEIIVLERSGYVSYANCGLPYYTGGVIKDKKNLTLQTPKSFWNRFRIDVRVRNEVVNINAKEKKVEVKKLDDGTLYEIDYDKLILSPGAKAIKPPLSGIDNELVMTLRTVEDSFKIHDFIENNSPRRAVVVGGGFIGLEMAENLMHKGIDTTLVQLDRQVMAPFDYDMACQIHSYLRSKGLDLRLNTKVLGFSESKDGQVEVLIEDQKAIVADLVIMAVGVIPDTGLAKGAGLELGRNGAIVVDEYMQTSEKDIYAVGDAVEIKSFISGNKTLAALAGPANKQGRIAADNIFGIKSKYRGTQASSVIKLFDMTAASTGLNETAAKAAGIAYDRVVSYSASHATYYPGAKNMTIKTLFVPESGKIIGAQIIGFDGVDKRIDVMATAIRAGLCAADLEEIELAYAPPFSSAKDPVNMAGYMIENIRAGLVKQYYWTDLENIPNEEGIVKLDVRTREEYSFGHMADTLNIPVDELRERMGELKGAKKIYVNCQSGLRSYIACRILSQNGFDCYNFAGGYGFYRYIAGDYNYDECPKHPCGLKI